MVTKSKEIKVTSYVKPIECYNISLSLRFKSSKTKYKISTYVLWLRKINLRLNTSEKMICDVFKTIYIYIYNSYRNKRTKVL